MKEPVYEMSSKKSSFREPIRKRAAKVLLEHGFAHRKQPLVVAVSGGADSLCLLHILLELREPLGLSLYLAHLDHGLRGAESRADALYVEHLAHQWHIPATIQHQGVLSYQKRLRIPLEQAAREVRYAFFAQVVREQGASAVALGHTADDQAETVLMHLIRGSGLSGLAGMRELSQLKLPTFQEPLAIIRPLLGTSREETGAYCQAHSITPRQDSSNLDPTRFRNAVRQELIPLLARYNPQIKEALARLARAAQLDTEFIQGQLAELKGLFRQEPGRIIISREAGKLPISLQRHLVRQAFTEVLGDTVDLEERHFEAVVQALTKPSGRVIDLPKGLKATADYQGITLASSSSATCPLPSLAGEYPLAVPGETSLPGWNVIISIQPYTGEARYDGGYSALLDLDKAGAPLKVRSRQPGDRFQPLGVEAEKKLQDFMVDAKIPRTWRDRVPLVCSPQGILWVVGYRISEKVKVTEATKQLLALKFQQA